jgi:spore coat polysaccharide biosynthesis protein SpsF (cytidylyltransferase family)
MKDIRDTVFIIQARTQSTRVPNKMLRKFADSNLFEIAINKVLSSSIIPKENFYLSVMDDDLKDIANEYGVNIFERSEESTQEPVTLQKALEWYNRLPFKHFVIINACNPLLKVETIDDFVPNVIVVDYADILAPENLKLEGREKHDETWKMLKNLASSRNCLVITATQSNRARTD